MGGLLLFFISEPGMNTLWVVSNAGVLDSKASDQELITKAKQLPEVKTSLAKYQNVTASVLPDAATLEKLLSDQMSAFMDCWFCVGDTLA